MPDEFSIRDQEGDVIRVTRGELYWQIEVLGGVGLIDLLGEVKVVNISHVTKKQLKKERKSGSKKKLGRVK